MVQDVIQDWDDVTDEPYTSSAGPTPIFTDAQAEQDYADGVYRSGAESDPEFEANVANAADEADEAQDVGAITNNLRSMGLAAGGLLSKRAERQRTNVSVEKETLGLTYV